MRNTAPTEPVELALDAIEGDVLPTLAALLRSVADTSRRGTAQSYETRGAQLRRLPTHSNGQAVKRAIQASAGTRSLMILPAKLSPVVRRAGAPPSSSITAGTTSKALRVP